MFKDSPIRNRFAAEQQAAKVMEWWHKRGYTQIKAWVEESSNINDFGTQTPVLYNVRMNYEPDVEQLRLGNIIQ